MRLVTDPDGQRSTRAVDLTRLGVAGAEGGHVYLVGAGPGDPGLLTVRAAALLATADLIAHDRLAPDEVLALAHSRAEIRCVGKRPGRPSWSQADINELVVDAARSGRSAVRLKGGDPFVFGRGGEEAVACREAGVPVEVVSGVTSAIAAPGAAGIPVTHRGVAAGVAVVTGHEDPAKGDPQLDWSALARFPGTLVFLMGVGRLGRITGMLLANGMEPTTPVALVRWGTTEQQEVVRGDLVSIVDEVRRADLRPPATIVVGEVVNLRETIVGTPAEAAREPTQPDDVADVTLGAAAIA